MYAGGWCCLDDNNSLAEVYGVWAHVSGVEVADAVLENRLPRGVPAVLHCPPPPLNDMSVLLPDVCFAPGVVIIEKSRWFDDNDDTAEERI